MHTLLTQIIETYTTQHTKSTSNKTLPKAKSARSMRYIQELLSTFKELDVLVQHAGKFDPSDSKMLETARVCADFIQIVNDLLPHPSVTISVALHFSRYLYMDHNDCPPAVCEPRSPRITSFNMKPIPIATFGRLAQDNVDEDS